MKRICVALVVCTLVTVPALGTPILEFYGFIGDSASGCSYDASTATLTFGASIIGAVYSGTTDAAVTPGAYMHIPDMVVGGSSGNRTLPGGTIAIANQAGDMAYLTGTLASGDLVPQWTGATAYTLISADIQWTGINNTISSGIINDLYAAGVADFHLIFTDASVNFESTLQGNEGNRYAGLAGSIIPEPCTILLCGIGAGLIGRLRRRMTL